MTLGPSGTAGLLGHDIPGSERKGAPAFEPRPALARGHAASWASLANAVSPVK